MSVLEKMGPNRGVALLGVIAISAALTWVALSPASPAAAPIASCAPRVVVVDLSPSARSPQLANLALQVVEDAAISAIACDEPLAAYGVAGGGADTTILTAADLTQFAPIGPNVVVRSLRFASAQRHALDALIARRLRRAYAGAHTNVTSIPALYELAAQQSTPSTDVALVTTGVNQDDLVHLNRPLADGEGRRLAQRLSVPHVTAKEVVVTGIAQVTSTIPPPGPGWSQQILAFNQALCRASGAPRCQLYNLAAPLQALGS